MADPLTAGIAIGTNLATSAAVALIKGLIVRVRTVRRCKSEREKLANKLEAIIPDAEEMVHLVEGLRKLKLYTKQADMRVVERWLQKLCAELLAASATVDQSSKNFFSGGVNQYSLSKKMTEHIMKLEKLEDQLLKLSVPLQILRDLVTEGRTQVTFPVVFANWAKEKDDILRRADVTRRHEAAACPAQAHSSHCGPAFHTGDPSQHSSPYIYHPSGHGDPAIYTEHATQYSYSYMNQHGPPFDVSSPQVDPLCFQFPPSPQVDPLCFQFPPSPQVDPLCFQFPPSPQVHPLCFQFPPSPQVNPLCSQFPPSPQVNPLCSQFPPSPQVNPLCSQFPPSPQVNLPNSQFPPSPQMNLPCSQFPFMNHPGPQFPPSPFMNHPAGSQVHHSYNHS